MGLTNATLVYKGRLEKDRLFAESHTLFYLLFHHALNTFTARTVLELRCLFLQQLHSAYLLPFASILAASQNVPCTRLNSKYGHSDTNPTYGEGYRLPAKSLLAQPHVAIDFQYLKNDQPELF